MAQEVRDKAMAMKVAGLMPALGRVAETRMLISRLFKTAGMPFELIVINDGDIPLQTTLVALQRETSFQLIYNDSNIGFWKALKQGIERTDAELIVWLANDLLPGKDWLKRAYDAHLQIFKGGEGLVAFNDGIWTGQHAAHGLISRSMLVRWYGKDYWPIAYQHSYGDQEISERAIAEGKFATAVYAVLYHNHVYIGNAWDDVYRISHASIKCDEPIFQQRKANGWA